jgi:hypothetical protein
MLDRFASTVSVTLAGIGNAQVRLSRQVEGLGQRVEQFIDRTDETIARLDQAIAELKAGQEQQSRILDYLLRAQNCPQSYSRPRRSGFYC